MYSYSFELSSGSLNHSFNLARSIPCSGGGGAEINQEDTIELEYLALFHLAAVYIFIPKHVIKWGSLA